MLILVLGLPPKQLWKVRLPHHLVALLVFQDNPKKYHLESHLESPLPHHLLRPSTIQMRLKLNTNVLKLRGLPQKKLLLQRGV